MSTVQKEAPQTALRARGDADGVALLSDRVTVIRPASRWPRIEVRGLWQYRELAFTLAWRDLKVRYKQSLIGASWAILQPVMQTVIFTFIFGKFAKVPSEGLPYQVFVFSGLLPWAYFASALNGASSSITVNAPLVTKIYFPRVLLPLAAITIPVADFLCASTVLFGMIAWYGLGLSWYLIFAPLFIVLAAVTALGVGLFFATINVRYRDVPYAIPFIIQSWLFLSPVVYPLHSLGEPWATLLYLNPIASVIGGFRWSVFETPAPSAEQLALSCGAALVFILVGLAFFRSSEPRFADTI